MAIRKFRKNLKPFIWIITILFIMSSAVMYYGQIKNNKIFKAFSTIFI